MGCEHTKDYAWAMQFMDGLDKPASFSFLGSHYRGWKVYKVCNECWRKYDNGEDIIIKVKADWYVCNKTTGVHKSPF
jgi:hypothetical protein